MLTSHTSRHYHINNFDHELVNPQNGNVLVAGTKQPFRGLSDEDGGKSHGFDCHDNGITSGWGDWYYKQLVGQWIHHRRSEGQHRSGPVEYGEDHPSRRGREPLSERDQVIVNIPN